MTNEELDIYSDEILNIVSANVKKYRELKGYSQMQLALEIGMSSGAYLGRAELRIENHHFNIKHLAKISKVLNISIASFFKFHNDTSKKTQL
ncbi:MAG: helix-turn-helix transcriptional regulator [Sulfurimonas sp.]